MPSYFGALDNLILSLRDLFVHMLQRNLPVNSSFLELAISFLSTEEIPNRHDFGWHAWNIRELLTTHDISSPEVINAVDDLHKLSLVPCVELVPADIWGYENPQLAIHTHLRSTLTNAVANIAATSRSIYSPDVEKYLPLLLTHESGWSATYPEHMNDEWVRFFRTSYPHLKGLLPILDSLFYVEELSLLPEGRDPERPEFLLLATP